MFLLQRGDSGSVTVTLVSRTRFVFVTVIVNFAVPSTKVGLRVCDFESAFATILVSSVCTFGLLTIAIAGCEREISCRDAVASELSTTMAPTAAATTRRTATTTETWSRRRQPKLTRLLETPILRN